MSLMKLREKENNVTDEELVTMNTERERERESSSSTCI